MKSGSVVEKINPGNQKNLFLLLIAGEKFERELNLNFCRFFYIYASRQRSPTLNLDEIQGSKKHSGTWLHPARLHSGEEQSFQLHVERKKNWGVLNGEF